MTGIRLTEDELAEIRADVELAASGRWVGVPAGGDRFAAGMRIADRHAAKLLAEVDLLTYLLEDARRVMASYGSPILGPVEQPPADDGWAKAAARVEELIRTGITDIKWADGLAICSRGIQCRSGINSVHRLTKRGRLPVHWNGSITFKCEGSSQKPAVILRYVPPTDPAGSPA